jgi:hypothetical protein
MGRPRLTVSCAPGGKTMQLHRTALLSACAGASISGIALAQPASTDLGTLASGTQNITNIAIAPGAVVWYRFTLSNPVPITGPAFLDVDSEGSALAPSNDTELGLFDSAGNLIATDDDSGSGLLSLLSFGSPLARPAAGGLAYAGQNGALPAGQYYLSISGFNSVFASGWSVTSTSTNTGTGQLNITLGNRTPPAGAYAESADAGQLPATAQPPTGGTVGSPLPMILGVHTSGDVDMYRINICSPANFSASTVNGAGFDTQLFLFNTSGFGIAFNDDAPGSGTVQSALSNQFVASLPAGEYLLAISQFDNDPTSGGLAIWSDTPYATERAPDGPGAAGAVDAWTGGGTMSLAYAVSFTGVCYAGGGGGGCYGNCDNSTTPPVLNVADFTCFLQRYAAGDSYANCDNSTTPPVLNVADFTCFLQRYAAGCP